MPRERTETQKKSKRQEFREMRRQREQRTRIITVVVIVLVALVIVGAVAAPSIQRALTPTPTPRPFSDIVPITPVERPQAQGTAMGNPDAPVRVDVWEDFQCSACVRYTADAEMQLIDSYIASGQVYYVFHQFPFLDDLAINKESDQAANASMCAAEQNRFWDFHDMLYANWDGENQGAFADSRLTRMAEILELDIDTFNACFTEKRYQKEINNDINQGKSQGVTGTPSVFVNGQIIKPGFVPSFADLSAAIDAALIQK